MNRLLIFLIGFLINFSLVAQNINMGNRIDTLCSGNFYDNGGPSGNYSTNTTLTHTFFSSGGQRLEFDFNNFQTRNIFNYLEVHDGPDRTYPLLGKFFFNTAPNIIRSTGNSLTFHFVSNGSSTRYGWSASIQCFGSALSPINMSHQAVDTSCAIAFYDNGGSQSNYRDSSYQVHTFCADNPSQLLIADFSAAVTSFNTGDTLWAYDGNDTTAPPLGVYVRNSRIETLSSRGRCLTFKFISDSSSSNGRGWQAAITCDTISAPPNNYLISTGTRYVCNGVFYDNGGNGNYPDNTNLTQTLRSYNGNRIIVDFRWFVTDNIFDYLEIHDGPDRSFPLIGKYYYTSRVPDSIISSGDALTFHWVTSGSGRDAGWVADISCGGPPLSIINMAENGRDTTCNGVFYDDGGILANYRDSAEFIHTICADASHKYLIADFNEAVTNLNVGDTLWAYDGSDTSAPPLGVYVRSSRIEDIVSTAACLTFKFRSDSSSSSATGWQAAIRCDTIAPAANNYLISTGTRYVCDGVFYDNGGNGNYPDNTNLTQTLRSYSGSRLIVDFRSFVTDNIFDYLEIHDGPDRSYPLIGKYYFTSRVPDSIISSGDALTFHWVTSGAGRAAGWVADISCAGPPLEVHEHTDNQKDTICSGVYYDNGGFNADYDSLQNTVHTFCSADTTKIFKMRFNQAAFDLRSGDSLIVYDGSDTTAPPIAKYVSQSILEPIKSESGCFTVHFKSDSLSQGRGWQAFFDCDSSFTPSEFRISTGVRYVCEGTFTDNGGSSGNYPNSTSRTQTYVAANRAHLQMIFQSFFTDNIFDDLYIYDGASTNAPLIGRYYYFTAPDTITSSGRALTFAFSSNSVDNASGWVADIRCVDEPPIPQLFTNAPICSGESLIIYSQPIQGVSYHWSGPNGFISNQDSVIIAQADSSQSGLYQLYVSQWGFNSDTASILVNVNPKPAPPVIHFSGSDSTFCPGDTARLVSSYSFGNLWSNGSTQATIQLTQADTIWLQHIDANGCRSDSSRKEVLYQTSPSPPNISLSGDTALCEGDSIVLTSSYAQHNLWSTGDSSRQITVQQNGSYSVQYTDTNGCSSLSDSIQISRLQAPAAPIIISNGNPNFCQGDSLALQSNYVQGNTWNSGDSSAQIWVKQAGTFYATYTDTNGCVSDTSNYIQTSVNPLPAPPIISINSGSLTFCQGDSVSISSSYAFGNRWNSGDTTVSLTINNNGTFYVQHTDTLGCTSDTSLHLTTNVLPLPAPPVITVTQGSLQICTGDSVTLRSSYSFGNRWNTTDTAAKITVLDSGRYYVQHQDVNGCLSDTSQNVKVELNTPPALPVISLIGSDTLDAGVNAQNYAWFLNDTLIPMLNSRQIVAVQSGDYTVVAYNANCASDTSAVFNLLLTNVEEIQSNQFSIYPNPSEGYFFISSKVVDYRIQLSDIKGRMLFDKTIRSKKSHIDISNEANGLYLIRFVTELGSQSYKLIKR
ncbi:MAG: CUB domain-containing protein [Vicingaceae bacterium]